MINYFPYDWKGPESADDAVQADRQRHADAVERRTPSSMHVAHQGLRRSSRRAAQAPISCFLIDVSGSMDAQDRLPLLKSAFRLLVDKLQARRYRLDRHLCRRCRHRADADEGVGEGTKILAAIDNLQRRGGTDGARRHQGSLQACRSSPSIKDGVNRVDAGDRRRLQCRPDRSTTSSSGLIERKRGKRRVPVGVRLRPRQSQRRR